VSIGTPLEWVFLTNHDSSPVLGIENVTSHHVYETRTCTHVSSVSRVARLFSVPEQTNTLLYIYLYNNCRWCVATLSTSRTTAHEPVAVAVRRGEIGRDAAIEYVVDEGLWHATKHPRRKSRGYAWVASTAFDQIARARLGGTRRLETTPVATFECYMTL
jgi:hypothetical protein